MQPQTRSIFLFVIALLLLPPHAAMARRTTPPEPTATTTTLVSSLDPAPAGANVTLTATVAGASPTGSVTFTDGNAAIAGCSAIALSGKRNTKTAACSTSTLAAGTHSVVARYDGDPANDPSSSTPLAQVIGAPVGTASKTTLSTALNPAPAGAIVAFTATVTGAAPTGSVNFAEGNTSLTGCAAVALTGSGNTKTAACSTNTLTAGTHSISASYGGDANNTKSASAAVTQTISGLPPSALPEKDAARLLQQGTWGATLDEIKRVARVGTDAWLTEQFATPATSYTAYAEQNIAQNKQGANNCTGTNMQNGCPWQVNSPAFYKQAFEGSDQLRQRVANALLQIAVISIANGRINDAGTAMPNYLDMLGMHAFGNFRDLLKDVTLHPGMGIYLDMLGSTLEAPNENYAREVLQLFSIGTVLLNDDGTPQKDAQGKTLPTYDEDVVQGFAKAFTGWHFAGQDTTKSWKFYWPDAKWTVPMQPWKARRCPQDGRWPAGSTTGWCDTSNPAKSYPPPHDPGAKTLLQYRGAPFSTLPSGQSPETDLENAIDNIFNHPNVGPFIVKPLIQRLVTSNPTPGYVQRVVRVFNNNGNRVRGDMKAVVRAILLDSEARSATVAAGNTFGKLREPVVKFLHLHRAFNARTSSGYYNIWDLSDPEDLGQAPLNAPSVFNYYGADFSPAGPIGQAGLVGPEFELMSTSVVSGFSSFTNWAVVGGFGRYESDTGRWIKPDYDRYLVGTTGTPALADNPQAMVDELDLLLTAGNLKAKFKSDLVAALNKVTRGVAADQRNDRFRIAMWQIIHSAEYAVQR